MSNSYATPWTVARQPPLSMGFPGQECYSHLSFPTRGDLPKPGIEPSSPALEKDSLPLSHQGSPSIWLVVFQPFSHAQLFVTLWAAARQASLPFTISQSLLKLRCIESVYHSTISSSVIPSPPAFNLFQHMTRDFLKFSAWGPIPQILIWCSVSIHVHLEYMVNKIQNKKWTYI